MAFNLENLGRWSVSYNAVAPTKWSYNGDKGDVSDELSVITASGYFDGAPSTYFRVGDSIYINSKPGASIDPVVQNVRITGLSPITVAPVNGLAPIVTVVHTIETAMNPVGLVQVVNLSGLLSTDFVTATPRNNPQATRILSILAQTDQFTLTFDINPGVGLQIQTMAFRQTF